MNKIQVEAKLEELIYRIQALEEKALELKSKLESVSDDMSLNSVAEFNEVKCWLWMLDIEGERFLELGIESKKNDMK